MSKIAERIPQMTDEQLLNLFANATQKLSESKNIEAAEVAIAAIEHEWKKRLDAARTGGYKSAVPDMGMLATLGYRVGAANGETTAARRKILKYVLERRLPVVASPAYTDAWGEPNSRRRYSKLVQFLESQLTNPAHRAYARAIVEWSEDLDWVRHKYSHLSC